MTETRRYVANPGRRAVLAAAGAVAVTPAFAAVRAAPPQARWPAPPRQAPAREGLIDLPGVRLWHWDTGGPGPAVILLHPATGSADIWGYQQPVLAAAGFRVIAYSRRGHRGSESGSPEARGTAVEDLNNLADALQLDRFHLVGSAAGGFIPPDYALSHPQRLISLTIACSLAGVRDPGFLADTARMLAPGFSAMPAAFRELGPAYRAANPEGVARWEALEATAGLKPRVQQPPANVVTWAALESLRIPALLIGGDADLFMPPPRVRQVASHIRGAETAIIAEAGHSAYWEQPEAFNAVLLKFLRRTSRRRT